MCCGPLMQVCTDQHLQTSGEVARPASLPLVPDARGNSGTLTTQGPSTSITAGNHAIAYGAAPRSALSGSSAAVNYGTAVRVQPVVSGVPGVPAEDLVATRQTPDRSSGQAEMGYPVEGGRPASRTVAAPVGSHLASVAPPHASTTGGLGSSTRAAALISPLPAHAPMPQPGGAGSEGALHGMNGQPSAATSIIPDRSCAVGQPSSGVQAANTSTRSPINSPAEPRNDGAFQAENFLRDADYYVRDTLESIIASNVSLNCLGLDVY